MFKAMIVTMAVTGGLTVARELYVPNDFATIQEALNAAQHGDTVVVRRGVYLENINFHGKAVHLVSESGPDDTIIDGSNAGDQDRCGSVVSFVTDEGPNSAIEGFTLRGGIGWLGPLDLNRYGGGVMIFRSSPKVINCIITDNSATSGGGVMIWQGGAAPEVTGCTITRNTSTSDGGGLSVFLAGPAKIMNNAIKENATRWFGGGICSFLSETIIFGNVITHNTCDHCGGGVLALIMPGSCQDKLVNNTICFNYAARDGGGLDGGGRGFGQTMAVVNNIFYRNVAGGSGNDTTCSPDLMYNNLISNGTNAGVNGNIDGDPLFVNATRGDFRLRPGSPCVDAGTPVSLPATTELFGNLRVVDGNDDGAAYIDIGAAEYVPVPGPKFIRGDVNDDGTLDIADSVTCLDGIFGDGQFACEDAADANDDGTLNVADPVYILEVLFGESSGWRYLPKQRALLIRTKHETERIRLTVECGD